MELVIRPQKKLAINWRELWSFRRLFYTFAWRDIKVRYKQTILGAAWAILQPFVSMVVFTLFFNKVAGISSGSTPYAIFSFAGLLFWNYFANSINGASNSLLNNQAMITKIYFPRVIVPISATVVSLIDFAFASAIFVALMFYFRIFPSLLGILLLVPLIILTFLAASGIGMFFAALNVKYRDIRVLLPFLIQILLFLTPVIYPVELVPERFQSLLYLNPMTGIISAARYTLIGQGSVNWELFTLSVLMSVAAFVIGLAYFKMKEREFADVI